jgi:hypothetical protein
MTPIIAFLLATATALLTLAITIHKGDILKSAPGWVEPLLFSVSGALYLLAGILALINYKRERKKEATIPPSLPSPQAQHNEQRVEANPRIEQNVYVGERHAPPAPAPVPTRPLPELELIDCKATMIAYSSQWEEVNPVNLGTAQFKPNAFVAIFRNKPAPQGKAGTRADHATAHLIYRNEKAEQQVVDYGTWLGYYEHAVDFKASESRALILSSKVAIGHTDGTYVFDNPHKFNVFSNPRFYRGQIIYAPTPKLLLRECSEVEVAIISNNVTLYHGRLRHIEDSSGEMIWAPWSEE